MSDVNTLGLIPNIIFNLYKKKKKKRNPMNRAEKLLTVLEKVIASDGSLFARSDWADIVHDAIEGTTEDLADEYEQEAQIEQIEYQARDGFIPFTDGGWEGRFLVDLGYMSGSGNFPSNKKANAALQKAVEDNQEMARDDFIQEREDELKAIPGVLDKNGEIDPDKVNYHDLYELKQGDLAERLSEKESEYMSDDGMMIKVYAFYYNPKNSDAIKDDHTLLVSGTINWEHPYFRDKRGFAAYAKEHTFNFKDAKDLKKQLEKALKSIVKELS